MVVEHSALGLAGPPPRDLAATIDLEAAISEFDDPVAPSVDAGGLRIDHDCEQHRPVGIAEASLAPTPQLAKISGSQLREHELSPARDPRSS